jgi:hypothetical protein
MCARTCAYKWWFMQPKGKQAPFQQTAADPLRSPRTVPSRFNKQALYYYYYYTCAMYSRGSLCLVLLPAAVIRMECRFPCCSDPHVLNCQPQPPPFPSFGAPPGRSEACRKRAYVYDNDRHSDL